VDIQLTIWENSSLLGRKAYLLGEQFTTLENKNCLTVLDYSLLPGRTDYCTTYKNSPQLPKDLTAWEKSLPPGSTGYYLGELTLFLAA
jgi:hypothetical protein